MFSHNGDIKKSFDKAFINVFMSTMPVRIVLADDAAQGPYNYIYLCMAHNGAFWPDAKVDILNLVSF